MLTRCPKCGKQIDEDADICEYCKYDFTKNVIKGSGRRVAPQDPTLKAPEAGENSKGPDMRREEDILPPHMLEGARQVDLTSQAVETPKGGGTGFYVLIGAVILGALAAPKLLKKEEPPPPELTAAAPELEEETGPKKVEAAEENKEAAQAPAPPVVKRKATAKRKRKKRRPQRRVAKASAVAASNSPRPPPRPSRTSKWRIRGKLIDIISLKPIPDADLIFVASNGQRVATATGPGGDFRVSMPPAAGGYSLRITHPDYDSKYLADKGHTGMDEDERKKAAEKLTSSFAKNLSIKPSGDGRMNQDYLLVPRPKHGMSLEEALLKGGAQ
ncbi:MAG: zinc ribbon domain-containing protein [Elusimicrobiota bacterium]